MEQTRAEVAHLSYVSEVKCKVLDIARMLLDDSSYTSEHAAKDLMVAAWLLVELEEVHFNKYKDLIQKITGKPFLAP